MWAFIALIFHLRAAFIVSHKNHYRKTLQDNYKLKQFVTTKPLLQRILKVILHTNKEKRNSQLSKLMKEYIS
jgi:hypothetical protein